MEKQSVQRGALIKRKNGTDLYETLKRDPLLFFFFFFSFREKKNVFFTTQK